MWQTDIVGVAPSGVVLKFILKNKYGDKRFVLAALGVHPKRGGRTWLLSPSGFVFPNPDKTIHQRGGRVWPVDLPESWCLVTNAVLFVSGPRQQTGSELRPHFVEYKVTAELHDAVFENAFQMVVKTRDKDPSLVPSLADLMSVNVTSEEPGEVVVDSDAILSESSFTLDAFELGENDDDMFCCVLWLS